MNLLITGALKKDEALFRTIENSGYSITFVQDERIPLSEQGVDPSDFCGVICNALFLYTPIDLFHNLKFIQLTSAGFDRVDMEFAKANGIKVFNARGVYSAPMAEFAVCGVLQLYKQSRFFYDRQREHVWEKHRGLLEINGKNVLIIGCGNVGTECAKRFAAFGCDVYGVDLYPRQDGLYKEMHGLDRLDGLLPDADIIVLTLPLTVQTKGLMNNKRFRLLKQNAVIVNIARGGVIETDALIDALHNIGGAVLDVFENEPLDENSPLWDMENVIITPHNSFVGENNNERLKRLIIADLRSMEEH